MTGRHVAHKPERRGLRFAPLAAFVLAALTPVNAPEAEAEEPVPVEAPATRTVRAPDGLWEVQVGVATAKPPRALQSPISSRHVTSPFGMRWYPITGGYYMHEGVDLASPVGESQMAAESGRVVLVEPDGTTPTSGNRVTIDHGLIRGRHVVTRYHHLSAFNVSEGQSVTKGDVIGWTGETGRVTGPHVHFEVWLDGAPVDPTGIVW